MPHEHVFDVLLQGNPFCDLTFTFTTLDHLPPLGHEVFADRFALNPGGIFNIASALNRLGFRVGLRAEMGNDIFSRFVAERMREAGLSFDLVTQVDRPLPVVTAGVSFPHDRLFISYYAPRDAAGEPRITLDDLDRYRPRALFSYGELGHDLMREARARGILVYVDGHWNPDYLRSSSLREALAYVDVFSPNLPEALEMTGTTDADAALEILRQWCRTAVIKRGPDGCIAWHGGAYYAVPAIPVQAVETTGAGDNFNAGLIYGLLQGYPFEACLQCANIVGGLSTMALGGCGGDISAAEVERWLGRLSEEASA